MILNVAARVQSLTRLANKLRDLYYALRILHTTTNVSLHIFLFASLCPMRCEKERKYSVQFSIGSRRSTTIRMH